MSPKRTPGTMASSSVSSQRTRVGSIAPDASRSRMSAAVIGVAIAVSLHAGTTPRLASVLCLGRKQVAGGPEERYRAVVVASRCVGVNRIRDGDGDLLALLRGLFGGDGRGPLGVVLDALDAEGTATVDGAALADVPAKATAVDKLEVAVILPCVCGEVAEEVAALLAEPAVGAFAVGGRAHGVLEVEIAGEVVRAFVLLEGVLLVGGFAPRWHVAAHDSGSLVSISLHLDYQHLATNASVSPRRAGRRGAARATRRRLRFAQRWLSPARRRQRRRRRRQRAGGVLPRRARPHRGVRGAARRRSAPRAAR